MSDERQASDREIAPWRAALESAARSSKQRVNVHVAHLSELIFFESLLRLNCSSHAAERIKERQLIGEQSDLIRQQAADIASLQQRLANLPTLTPIDDLSVTTLTATTSWRWIGTDILAAFIGTLLAGGALIFAVRHL
jgi:hypothetical protein